MVGVCGLQDRELEEVRPAVVARLDRMREAVQRLDGGPGLQDGAVLEQNPVRPPRRVPVAVRDVRRQRDVFAGAERSLGTLHAGAALAREHLQGLLPPEVDVVLVREVDEPRSSSSSN